MEKIENFKHKEKRKMKTLFSEQNIQGHVIKIYFDSSNYSYSFELLKNGKKIRGSNRHNFFTSYFVINNHVLSILLATASPKIKTQIGDVIEKLKPLICADNLTTKQINDIAYSCVFNLSGLFAEGQTMTKGFKVIKDGHFSNLRKQNKRK